MTLVKINSFKGFIVSLNWKEHEFWVVSVVIGIKKPKKKTHDSWKLFIRRKNALLRPKKNNTLVSGNAGDEKDLRLGGRKKNFLSISLNFLNNVYT